MDDFKGLVKECATRVRATARTRVENESFEDNLRFILGAIDHASCEGKTYIEVSDKRILPDVVQLLKPHFNVVPKTTGYSDEKCRKLQIENYQSVYIGWGAFDVASMK